MTLLQQKTEIDGVTYQVTEMDSFRALRVQTKLMKILGPGLFRFVGSEGLTGILKLLDETNLDKSAATKLLPELIENFQDEEVNALVLMLFETGVFIKAGGASVPVEFETAFVGKPMNAWKVAWFIVEVNFLSMGESLKSSSPTTPKDVEESEA